VHGAGSPLEDEQAAAILATLAKCQAHVRELQLCECSGNGRNFSACMAEYIRSGSASMAEYIRSGSACMAEYISGLVLHLQCQFHDRTSRT
jgi:hypothetical protein